MTHWFHRNPLKATGMQNFDIKMVAQDVEALKICSDLKQSRLRLLELLPDPHHEMEKVETALKLYLSLMRGLLEAGEGTAASKLRHSLTFRWTDSLLGNQVTGQADAAWEGASMLMNVAFWMMKHSAMMAVKAEVKVEEAKEVHTSLKKAAGMFLFVQDNLLPQLVEKGPDGGDLDIRVISAYLLKCKAEAQEVTIARAIELKHNPELISALAHETSKLFTTAADSLHTLDQTVVGHWRMYFELKAKFYLAYAHNYQGEASLAEDKCGEAIRSLQESKTCYEKAAEMAKEYSKIKGPGTQAQPDTHLFFKRLAPILNRTLEKCERENGFIYHQKVPFDPPELKINEKTHGLVAPEVFELPPISPLWTPVAYAAFDISKNVTEDPKKSKSNKKDEAKVEPVKEVPIKDEGAAPKTETGCILS